MMYVEEFIKNLAPDKISKFYLTKRVTSNSLEKRILKSGEYLKEIICDLKSDFH